MEFFPCYNSASMENFPSINTVVRNKKKMAVTMPKIKKDDVRENRIIDEIIVDAYDAEEQAMG